MAIFLKAKWENIIMANYALPPEILLPYLPSGVELDLFEGKAYASLVGFMFKSSKIFGLPIPFYGTFEEVNLRFYVKRKEANEIKRSKRNKKRGSVYKRNRTKQNSSLLSQCALQRTL